MAERRTCAVCPRPVWEGGGEEEEYCLFHSEQCEAKKDQFKAEIEAVLKGQPSRLFLIGKREYIYLYDFTGFRFPAGCSDFRGHEFSSDAVFSEATFLNSAYFDEATFRGVAMFAGATFRGNAVFDGVKVGGNALFFGAMFRSFARFERAVFGSDAKFFAATFDGNTGFDEAAFRDNAEFYGATFSGSAWFNGATFSGNAVFDGARLKGNTWFSRAIFEGDARFEGTILENSLHITSNSRIEKVFSLNNCLCKGNILISDSSLGSFNADDLSYDGILTLENVTFTNPKKDSHSTLRNVYLERAKFIGTDLSHVAFGGAFIREVIFDRVTFGQAAETKGGATQPWLCGRPNEAIYEERVARKSGTKEDFETAETVYRTLKHTMEEMHAGNLARRMRAGELEMRLHVSTKFWEKLLLILYRFINGFGLRWFRALLMSFGMILLFASSYFIAGKCGAGATFEEAVTTGDRVEYKLVYKPSLDALGSLRHSVETATIIISPKYRMDNDWVGLIEIAQRIICPLLFAMFVQAVINAARD
ncbi:MAG: pentapeptide repeat-containing protein [Deltaproteobacteria bacterium]|nr:pentapeptide repeat-containing protein [Deltaproteobacteria bacterium]